MLILEVIIYLKNFKIFYFLIFNIFFICNIYLKYVYVYKFPLTLEFYFFYNFNNSTLFNSFSDIIKISYSIALNKNLRFIKEKNKIHLRVLFFLVASICLIIPLVTKYISSDFELEIDYFRSNLFILGIFSFFYSVVSFLNCTFT